MQALHLPHVHDQAQSKSILDVPRSPEEMGYSGARSPTPPSRHHSRSSSFSSTHAFAQSSPKLISTGQVRVVVVVTVAEAPFVRSLTISSRLIFCITCTAIVKSLDIAATCWHVTTWQVWCELWCAVPITIFPAAHHRLTC